MSKPTVRRPWAVLLVPMMLAALLTAAVDRGGGAARAQEALADGRVQLHRNGNRGVPYLPLARQGESTGALMLSMHPWKTIELDGIALQNVYGGLRPIDVDGDGSYEFVHFNGYRYIQVWSQDGRKLWRVATRTGRLHDYRAGTHRDTIAVLDVDGDGKQDVAHCWIEGGRKSLVYRRGLDGAVIRSVALGAGPDTECQIAAFKMAPSGEIQVLVAQSIAGASRASCRHNWVGYWARPVAYDLQARMIWDRETCDAGHYAWPLDQDYDGQAEAVFVGKYLIRPDGSLQCSLSGWPRYDHVDALSVADLDLARPGLEVVAVGASGLALFEAATCRQIWRISTSVIRDPQHVVVAKLDPASPTPLIVVDERGSVRRARTLFLNGQGRVVATNPTALLPMQNANLDGALGTDELVTGFGSAVDPQGNQRVRRWWYWQLRGTKVRETQSGFYPGGYDRWQAFPLVADIDRDGREEIVQWGQSLIVIGKTR